MENQTITPSQNSQTQPAPQPSLSNTPPELPANPIPAPVADWSTGSQPSNGNFGRLSLLFSSLAVGIFILLIFATGLVDSLSKAYIWFFIILALGIAGLVLGLISEKGKDKINLLGLVGIVVSIIVCINCLIIGSYYIKLQMTLNSFKSQYNTSSSSGALESTYSTQ